MVEKKCSLIYFYSWYNFDICTRIPYLRSSLTIPSEWQNIVSRFKVFRNLKDIFKGKSFHCLWRLWKIDLGPHGSLRSGPHCCGHKSLGNPIFRRIVRYGFFRIRIDPLLSSLMFRKLKRVSVRSNKRTIEIQMPRSEALLADFPESSFIDLAEPVGVSSSVSRARRPVHLSDLASGPGGHCGSSKQAILIMLHGRLSSNISAASPSLTVSSRPAWAATTSKHIVWKSVIIQNKWSKLFFYAPSPSQPLGFPPLRPHPPP